MRERKIVKLRVDMYNDTKFKIIDMKPERDLIHYVWTRILTLAGKVNLEGELFMSKTLPYTIETLAIEFNRDFKQIKLALDVFIELEMIELTEVNVYRVKNFVKHQNIKVEEKIKSKVQDVKCKEIVLKEASKDEIYNNEEKESENKISQNNIPILLVNKKINKKKKKEKSIKITEEDDDTDIVCFYDGVRPLDEGESLVSGWKF